MPRGIPLRGDCLDEGYYDPADGRHQILLVKAQVGIVFKVFRGCDKELGRELMKGTRTMPRWIETWGGKGAS